MHIILYVFFYIERVFMKKMFIHLISGAVLIAHASAFSASNTGSNQGGQKGCEHSLYHAFTAAMSYIGHDCKTGMSALTTGKPDIIQKIAITTGLGLLTRLSVPLAVIIGTTKYPQLQKVFWSSYAKIDKDAGQREDNKEDDGKTVLNDDHQIFSTLFSGGIVLLAPWAIRKILGLEEAKKKEEN